MLTGDKLSTALQIGANAGLYQKVRTQRRVSVVEADSRCVGRAKNASIWRSQTATRQLPSTVHCISVESL